MKNTRIPNYEGVKMSEKYGVYKTIHKNGTIQYEVKDNWSGLLMGTFHESKLKEARAFKDWHNQLF